MDAPLMVRTASYIFFTLPNSYLSRDRFIQVDETTWPPLVPVFTQVLL